MVNPVQTQTPHDFDRPPLDSAIANMINEPSGSTEASGDDVPSSANKGPMTPSRSWRERVSVMSMEMARALCGDARLGALDPDALGVLIRIHALTRIGRFVPQDILLASRVLGTTRRRLQPALHQLQGLVPDLLVHEMDGLTVPTLLGGEQVTESVTTVQRRNAAHQRWAATQANSFASDSSNDAAVSAAGKARGRKPAAKAASALEPGVPGDPHQAALFAAGSAGEFKLSKAELAIGLKAQAAPIPEQVFADLFNLTCKSLHPVSPTLNWAASRRSAVGNRLKEKPEFVFWQQVFTRVERSDFLTGRNAAWCANFDWILKPANLQKIVEGNYDNRGKNRRELWDQGGDSTGFEDATNDDQSTAALAPFLTEAGDDVAHTHQSPAAPSSPEQTAAGVFEGTPAPFLSVESDPSTAPDPIDRQKPTPVNLAVSNASASDRLPSLAKSEPALRRLQFRDPPSNVSGVARFRR